MTTVRPFTADDLFKFNNINLDPLTETYNLSFYFQYMATWPDMFYSAESPNGTMMGYMMGKAEGKGIDWHGHVTAITVAPEFRRLGLADLMMDQLEVISDKIYKGYFVDLFVRKSNTVAIKMYEQFGYSIYRKVIGYYSGISEEDAYDMRKALSRDVHKESVVPLGRDVYPHELY
ncbi:N-acetyltransferase [Conidiobolus coronatus NRRL 28638]|uniref:N-acetyltransferase n=1 Tax=Conidiobolus coronatus (strain ATCC 28846 / CBS 209.66 / NRRL 28638) TaxID=796925 RepID=A0A137P9A5_CONC2|nr:N-acetyltransferase [Conidiobolus coronatus NRRL 28638]|eukprot:KXN71583.1 N-acetyltransferase [Conidiobolus coronatus NRRL 28638]